MRFYDPGWVLMVAVLDKDDGNEGEVVGYAAWERVGEGEDAQRWRKKIGNGNGGWVWRKWCGKS